MPLFLGRRDVPLDKDASARFLPWLIGFMVFLAALALAAAIAVSNLAARWDKGLSDQITVQVPPPEAGAEGPDQDARVTAVLETLRGTRGVTSAARISEDRMQQLLEPWLGDAARAGTGSLPLPVLVAVDIDRADPPDLGALQEALQAAAPGAELDDHQRTLGQLLEVAHTLQLLALAVVGLVGAAAVVTVIFVTRTGLAVHRQVIELLHLIGAHDGYVAGQFQRHALRLGLVGGLIGLALAGVTLAVLSQVVDVGDSAVIPELTVSPAQWALLAAIPVVTALVAMVTARLTVLRTLARFS